MFPYIYVLKMGQAETEQDHT